MIAIKIGVVAVGGIVAILLLKNNGSLYTVFLEVLLVLFILWLSMPQIKELLNIITGLDVSKGAANGLIKIILKVFSISLIGNFTCDICRDNGETSLADAVDFSVKVICLTCALPVFTSVLTVAATFLNR